MEIISKNIEINCFKNKTFTELFSKSIIKEIQGHKKRVYTLDWNADGTKLVTGSVDCNIKIWQQEYERGIELKGHSDSITCVKFLNNDNNILLSCSNDKTIKLWDIRTNKYLKSEKRKEGIKSLSLNYNSSIFAFSNKDEDIITFFDLKKFSELKKIEITKKAKDFEFDSTNSFLIIATQSGSLFINNAKTLSDKPISIIEAHYPPINTINISKNLPIFATGADDALICLWDINEMISYKILKKSDLPIKKVSFSYDSLLIASIYEGNNVDIFECKTGECIYTFPTESLNYSLCWNPNQYLLAFCGDSKNRNSSEEGVFNILSIN